LDGVYVYVVFQGEEFHIIREGDIVAKIQE